MCVTLSDDESVGDNGYAKNVGIESKALIRYSSRVDTVVLDEC